MSDQTSLIPSDVVPPDGEEHHVAGEVTRDRIVTYVDGTRIRTERRR